MAQIRVKRTGTALSNPQLLSGEFGIVNETVYYGKYYNDNALHPALKLAGQNIANTFTVLPQLDSSLHSTLNTASDYAIVDKKYVDDAKESALVKINSTTGSNTYTITSADTNHLTVGTADANHDIKIALKNIAFLDRNVTFQQNVTVTGNLTVNGTTTTLNTQTLAVKDNLIVTNSGGADISAENTNSGLAIRLNNNASDNGYGFVYNEGELKIGKGTIDNSNGSFTSDNLQSVLTRTGLSTTSNQMVYWDYTNKTMKALTVTSPLSFGGSTLKVDNATASKVGVVKPGFNLTVRTDGTLDARALEQPASSNKIRIDHAEWITTTGSDTNYGKYKYEIPFGSTGIRYVDINYAVEVLQIESETDGTGTYIEAPATVVKDNKANKLTIYTEYNDWDGYVIATSGGKLDSSIAGHQIYNRTGTNNGTALTSRANLAFGEGLIVTDHSETGSSVVRLNVDEGNGIIITKSKQTIIAAKDARSDEAGVVKLGSDTVQSVEAAAVTATANRTYAIQENANGQLVVNVPWINTNYINRTLTFQDNGTTRGTFNSLNPSELSTINFINAISTTFNNNTLTVTDTPATAQARGTVIAGTNNGTISRYENGVIDVDIDCGDWA